ncbi:unnamed protein product, partial [Ectocarpus sp. 12 AP-2014]
QLHDCQLREARRSEAFPSIGGRRSSRSSMLMGERASTGGGSALRRKLGSSPLSRPASFNNAACLASDLANSRSRSGGRSSWSRERDEGGGDPLPRGRPAVSSGGSGQDGEGGTESTKPPPPPPPFNSPSSCNATDILAASAAAVGAAPVEAAARGRGWELVRQEGGEFAQANSKAQAKAPQRGGEGNDGQGSKSVGSDSDPEEIRTAAEGGGKSPGRADESPSSWMSPSCEGENGGEREGTREQQPELLAVLARLQGLENTWVARVKQFEKLLALKDLRIESLTLLHKHGPLSSGRPAGTGSGSGSGGRHRGGFNNHRQVAEEEEEEEEAALAKSNGAATSSGKQGGAPGSAGGRRKKRRSSPRVRRSPRRERISPRRTPGGGEAAAAEEEAENSGGGERAEESSGKRSSTRGKGPAFPPSERKHGGALATAAAVAFPTAPPPSPMIPQEAPRSFALDGADSDNDY